MRFALVAALRTPSHERNSLLKTCSQLHLGPFRAIVSVTIFHFSIILWALFMVSAFAFSVLSLLRANLNFALPCASVRSTFSHILDAHRKQATQRCAPMDGLGSREPFFRVAKKGYAKPSVKRAYVHKKCRPPRGLLLQGRRKQAQAYLLVLSYFACLKRILSACLHF